MRYMRLISALCLVFVLGCSNKEEVWSTQTFIEHFKQSLIEQQLEVEEVAAVGDIQMQGENPDTLQVSQNAKHPDRLYIFTFDSAKQATDALGNTKFATTSETLVDAYTSRNIVVIHYVRPENIGDLEARVEKAVKQTGLPQRSSSIK
ncbi:hypothetical protein B9G55_14545 [Saccharibacillus sp. O16]|nr:hypothetical protein B9G55_14545 [Saccharibacillus sp. O16]